MRKSILLIVVLFIVKACKLTEKPEFVRVDKVDVLHADLSTVALKANAVFQNHNHVGGTLRTDNIDVFIDNHLVAKVSSEEFKVPAKDEFVIPLSVDFDTSKLVDGDNVDLLGSLLKQFLERKVIVQFKGELVYKVAGFGSTYPIDHVEEIIIK